MDLPESTLNLSRVKFRFETITELVLKIGGPPLDGKNTIPRGFHLSVVSESASAAANLIPSGTGSENQKFAHLLAAKKKAGSRELNESGGEAFRACRHGWH